MQQQAVDKLVASQRVLEQKMAEARGKKDTLKARAQTAKTTKWINVMVGSLDTSSALAAFDKMEEKVAAMEAQAEADFTVGALSAGGDDLSRRFALLEGASAVDPDDELQAMKKQLQSSSKPRGSLPEGRTQTLAERLQLLESNLS